MQTQSPQQPHQPPRTHLRDYWIVILKRVPLLVLFTGLGLGVAIWVTRNQKQLFRTGATIEMIAPRTTQRSTDFVLAPAILQDTNYLNTQLQKLEMGETLRSALETENVVARPQLKKMTTEELVRMHMGQVTARQRPGQYLVDVQVTGPNAEVLDDVTNALVRHFREVQRDEAEKRIQTRRQELEEKIAAAGSRMRMMEVDKRHELEAAGFTEDTFETEYLRLSEERSRYVDEQTTHNIGLINDEAAYAAFTAAVADPALGPESLSQHPRVLQHPELVLLRSEMARLRIEREELRIAKNLAEGHPDLQAIDRSLARMEKRRSEVQADFVARVIVDYEGRRAALERLDALVEERVARLREATKVKARIDEINADIGRASEDKRAAQRELEILSQNSFGSGEAVRIVAPAREPDANSPVSPNKPMNYTLGTLLGLFAGVGLSFLLDYLDDTIRTKDELQRITDIPLLGVIPRIEGKGGETHKKDLYAFHQPKSTVSEAYRGVRTALTMRSHGTRHRVLALTSAGPREGKSTTVINLATVLAYSSKRTLIIDADLRKPRIHKSFGLENARGLTNLIVSDGEPRDFCQATNVPGVDVLPSGPIPPNPSELLGSDKMRDIVARLRRDYDHVIIDTPPIGAVTDAAVLGTIVDGVILVVHAGKTRSGIVQRGLEQLRYINAPVEGVILNNLQVRGRYYPGYYNYYYYYSYYGAGKSRSRASAKSPVAAKAGEDAGTPEA